jgi:hypothetical protein
MCYEIDTYHVINVLVYGLLIGQSGLSDWLCCSRIFVKLQKECRFQNLTFNRCNIYKTIHIYTYQNGHGSLKFKEILLYIPFETFSPI